MPMNAIDILLYIVKHKREFPSLKHMTPAQALARLPEEDERYKQREEGLRAMLREISSRRRR